MKTGRPILLVVKANVLLCSCVIRTDDMFHDAETEPHSSIGSAHKEQKHYLRSATLLVPAATTPSIFCLETSPSVLCATNVGARSFLPKPHRMWEFEGKRYSFRALQVSRSYLDGTFSSRTVLQTDAKRHDVAVSCKRGRARGNICI